MRRLTVAAVAAVSTIVLTQTASAADLPRKAPVYMPPLPPLYSWTGWYVGLNAGGGWGNNGAIDNTLISSACSIAFPGACAATVPVMNANIPGQFDTHQSGFIGGGQIGYNWQFAPAWVAGIEADFQGANIKGDANFASGSLAIPGFTNILTLSGTGSQKLDWFGTLRGRLGWLATPQFLIYGTGGLAYGHVQTDVAFAGHITSNTVPFDGSTAVSRSDTRVGWTVGGGLEWMFAPQWSVKGEYLYYDLGKVTLNQTLTLVRPGDFISANVSSEGHYRGNIARLGVNYRF
jgi:outer membrane immunogenic protein